MKRGHVHQRHVPYRSLGIEAKRRLWLSRWRGVELVRCASCSTITDDLVGHVAARCAGSLEARDMWILAGRRV